MSVSNENSMSNVMVVRGNGRQSRGGKGRGFKEKYFDSAITTVSPSTTAAVSSLTGIAQGVGVTQRTGDTLIQNRFFLNYNVVVANADVYSSTRVIVFRYRVNTSLAVPVGTTVLQSSSDLSFYNFQLSNQYEILYDKVHFNSGTATAPTASTYNGFYGEIPLGGNMAARTQEFSLASVFGSNQLYILYVSDSGIAPFPSLTYASRLIFTEP